VERRWIIATNDKESNAGIPWAEICGLPCIAELLKRKGFGCADEVNAFLQPRLSSLSDPFLLPQMEAAVTRILQSIDRGERIVLFGDYDVDGITSLALLDEMLRSYGAAPELFLPLRMEEGYGLSPESVDRCCEQYHPQLLIAVDCGTSSVAEIAALKQRGVDVDLATLPLDDSAKRALRELNPRSYVGLAAKLVEQFAPPVKTDLALAKKVRAAKR